MAYTTSAQVKLRSRSNLEPADDPTALDATIAEGIGFAESRIDSRLGERFSVPFGSPIPAQISQIAADLAAYFALVEIYSGGADNKPTLLAQELKERAFESLEELASGKSILSDLASGSTSTSINMRSNTPLPGTIAGFDLVNRPSGNCVPLARYKRWG